MRQKVYDEVYEKNLRIIDGTCPFVKKIRNIVKEKYEEGGKKVIIVGDTNHPEIMGINGWCNDRCTFIAE